MRTEGEKWKVGFLIGIVAFVWMLLAGQAVWAHAELLEAYPAPGEVFYWNRPVEIRLRFSQPLVAEESRISLVRVTAKSITTIPLGEPTASPEDPRVTLLSLPELEPGAYTVTWHTKSVDGHPLDGSYEFEIHFRQQIITMVVAGTVFTLMGLLVFLRRAPPGEVEDA